MADRNSPGGAPPSCIPPCSQPLRSPRPRIRSPNSGMTCASCAPTGSWSYSYRLTTKGVKVAALFVLFQKPVCGPLANTLFHHRPTKTATLPAKIEAAYHKADEAIQHVIDLLAA